MSTNPDPPDPVVYRLRVIVDGVSPLIWRRLLLRSDTSTADLHTVLQWAFGWDDDHLHRFMIHGGEYGISYMCGIGFPDDPDQVRLSRFKLRPGERFTYEYDFTAGWRLALRVEQIFAYDPGRAYPACVDGGRAGPSHECAGPWDFMEHRQRHNIVALAQRFAALLQDSRRLTDERAELFELCTWINIDRFDRRALNRVLAGQGIVA